MYVLVLARRALIFEPENNPNVHRQTVRHVWFPALRYRSNRTELYFFHIRSVWHGNGTGATARQCGHGLRKRIRMNGNVMLETRHQAIRATFWLPN